MKDYILKSKLISERKWTEALIKKHLKTFDKETPNYYYKKAPSSKYFLLSRVLAIEETSEFKEDLEKSARIKQSSKKAVQTKIENLIEYANGIEISVPIMTMETLYNEAKRHYENLWEYRNNPKTVNGFDPDFFNRIAVNFLRHRLTSYENELNKIKGKTGKLEGLIIIRTKIYNKISEVYPELKEECEDQLISRLHSID